MHSPAGSRSGRNDDLEILRAYSILFVLFQHMVAVTSSETHKLLTRYVDGWTGVDLFFCISGFVIFGSLARTIDPGMPRTEAVRQIVGFWLRRFWRLAPAGWLWLVLGLVVALCVGTLVGNLGDAFASLLNIENFYRLDCNIAKDSCGGLLAQYWSLSLETQFYLIVPFGLAFLPRRWFNLFLAIVILVQFPFQRPNNGTEMGWFIRTDAIAWGVLLAQLAASPFRDLVEPHFLRQRAARIGFTFLLLACLASYPILGRLQFFVGLAALLCALLVWAASYNAGYISRALGANRLLLWIGTRSYSLYLVHIIIFKVARELFQAAGIQDLTSSGKALYILGCYGGTVIAAGLTYRYVEQPLRRHGRAVTAQYLARHAAEAEPASIAA